MKSWFFVILILAIVLKQILWSSFIPLWHFPDEQAHFAQAQNIAEGRGLNPLARPTTSREIYESEVLLGTFRSWSGNNKFTYHPEFNIEYGNTKNGLFENEIIDFPQDFRKQLVINEATGYPPIYYTLSAGVYRGFYPNSLLDRVFAVRVLNIIFYVGTVFVALLIARLTFPKNKLLQFTAALLVGFHPMFSFLSAGINSYNLFILLFSLGIYFSILVIFHGFKLRYIVWMLVVLILAIYTKHQGKVLPFLYLFPLLVNFFKVKKSRLFTLGTIGGVFLIGIGVTVRNLFSGQQFLPNVAVLNSQSALPDLNLFTHIKDTVKLTIAQTVPWYWGVFRWLSLTLPRSINQIINRAMILSAAGLLFRIISIIRKKSAFSKESLVTWFFIYASVMYYFAIVLFDFFFKKTHGFSFGIQGRYFLPTVIPHMILLLTGLYYLTPWSFTKKLIVKLGGVSMILLHSIAFFIVVTSYYDISSLKLFFLAASQYKPMFFKSPFLEIYASSFLITLPLLVWYYLRIKETHSETK